MPSNEGRGYVLRRLIRRAVRHGRKLGIDKQFMAELAQTVIAESKDGYPELEDKKEFILQVLSQEEGKFDKTIDQGLTILTQMQEELEASGAKELKGADAFKLYDTYGFPLDLTLEIMQEKGYTVDAQRFIDFYEAKGWMIGKNKMKDWRAAVRTWMRRPDEPQKQTTYEMRKTNFL